MSAPAWLHPAIARETIPALFKPLGNPGPDGSWLVYQRGPGKYGLAVVFKGKLTYHGVEKTDAGVWGINKKAYGLSETDLGAFITKFKGQVQGWPVKLGKFPPRGGSVRKGGGGGGGGGGVPPYLHGVIENGVAGGYLAGKPDGTFLVRERAASSDFALSVVFRGKPTHHLMAKGDGGNWQVNKKQYGTNCKTMPALVKALGDGSATGWPVKLQSSISVPSGGTPPKAAARGAPARPAASSKPAASGGGGGGLSRSKSTVRLPEWIHGHMENGEAANAAAGKPDGTFLVRERNPPDEYALTVVFKGKPTHHLLKKQGDVWTVNKKDYGLASPKLTALIKNLGQPVSGWPVPLTNPVSVKATGKLPTKTTKILEARKAQKASMRGGRPASMGAAPVEVQETTEAEWLHGEMGKDAAVKLLTAGGATDGKFMVWRSSDHASQAALSVIYKGRPTHHMLKKQGGAYMVGKKAYGGKWKTLADVVNGLKGSVQGWPVPLKAHVPLGGGGGGGGGDDNNDDDDDDDDDDDGNDDDDDDGEEEEEDDAKENATISEAGEDTAASPPAAPADAGRPKSFEVTAAAQAQMMAQNKPIGRTDSLAQLQQQNAMQAAITMMQSTTNAAAGLNQYGLPLPTAQAAAPAAPGTPAGMGMGVGMGMGMGVGSPYVPPPVVVPPGTDPNDPSWQALMGLQSIVAETAHSIQQRQQFSVILQQRQAELEVQMRAYNEWVQNNLDAAAAAATKKAEAAAAAAARQSATPSKAGGGGSRTPHKYRSTGRSGETVHMNPPNSYNANVKQYRTTLRKNKKGTVLVPLEKEDNRSATMRNVRNKIAQRSRAQSKVAAEPMETKVRVVGGGGRAGKGMFITMGGFTEQDGRFSHELDNDTEA